MKAYGNTGIKIYSNDFGHMINIAAMRIYGENFKNLLLQNQWTDGLETVYAASSTQVLQRVFEC